MESARYAPGAVHTSATGLDVLPSTRAMPPTVASTGTFAMVTTRPVPLATGVAGGGGAGGAPMQSVPLVASYATTYDVMLAVACPPIHVPSAANFAPWLGQRNPLPETFRVVPWCGQMSESITNDAAPVRTMTTGTPVGLLTGAMPPTFASAG